MRRRGHRPTDILVAVNDDRVPGKPSHSLLPDVKASADILQRMGGPRHMRLRGCIGARAVPALVTPTTFHNMREVHFGNMDLSFGVRWQRHAG